MNEKRFIQLINLYIDGEISSGELEELEREVAHDPRRRKTYHSYCRLQQASQVVYKHLGSALTESVDLKKYHILARNSTRCIRRGVLYSVGALAAACVTVVAAISVFQDSEWGGPTLGGNTYQTAYGSVEVFEPGAMNSRRDTQARFSTDSDSEPFFFAGRSSSAGQSQRKSEFLHSPQEPFQNAPRTSRWHEEFSDASSKRVIRGDSSFDVVPELASFQFQR